MTSLIQSLDIADAWFAENKSRSVEVVIKANSRYNALLIQFEKENGMTWAYYKERRAADKVRKQLNFLTKEDR